MQRDSGREVEMNGVVRCPRAKATRGKLRESGALSFRGLFADGGKRDKLKRIPC